MTSFLNKHGGGSGGAALGKGEKEREAEVCSFSDVVKQSVILHGIPSFSLCRFQTSACAAVLGKGGQPKHRAATPKSRQNQTA